VIEALQDTLAACQHSATRCILVNMPLHPGAYQVIPVQDEAAYRGLLAGVAGITGITIWDINTPACRAYLGEDSFFDLGHLNVLGAERFTTILAQLYSRRIAQRASWYLWVDSAADCAQISPSPVAR